MKAVLLPVLLLVRGCCFSVYEAGEPLAGENIGESYSTPICSERPLLTHQGSTSHMIGRPVFAWLELGPLLAAPE